MSILDSDSEIYYIALSLLHILRDEDSYSDIARLVMVLDNDNFDSLIDNCGGMTITIPTREEVNTALKTLIYYQLRCIRQYPTSKALKMSGASVVDATKVQSMSGRIRRYLRSINPNILMQLSNQNRDR